MTHGPLIQTQTDLDRGAAALAQIEPRFAPVLATCAPLPLRLKPQGFATLLDIIISQQVSVASADAIRARLAAAQLATPAAVLAAGEAGLRAAGLSRPKVRYALALAETPPDFDALARMSDAAAIDTLCALKGIGPWSAQIYVMFALGRADAFAPGDLALQEAAKVVFDLPARPDAPTLEALSLQWQPWRSVAARALFAYYRVVKNREGLG